MLVGGKVKLEVDYLDLKCVVHRRGPFELNSHTLNTKVGGSNVCNHGRVADILVVKLKQQVQLVDLESSAVVAKLDDGPGGVEV